MKNYYKTLGISQNSTPEEIKKAYRRLAIKCHPDKNPGQKFADEFKEINEAKQVLLDDFKKFQYDNILNQFLHSNTAKRRSFKPYYSPQGVPNRKAFVIGLVSSVVILLTVAFYEIPQDDIVTEPPVIAKTIGEPQRSPSVSKAVFSHSTKLKKFFRRSLVESSRVKTPLPSQRKKKHANKAYPLEAKVLPTMPKLESIEKRQLTSEDMLEILAKIRAEKERVGNSNNCIQIIKTNSSNIQNAFKLAGLLRSYGFIISGREKVNRSMNGIEINAQDNCIKVVIGIL